MELSSDQRERLLKAKLTALVRDFIEQATQSADSQSSGVVALDNGVRIPEVRGALTGFMPPERPGYVMGEFGTPLAVGAAMSWALKVGSTSITVFFDFDAGPAARFASYFRRTPADVTANFATRVRSVSGASSVEVDPEPAANEVEAQAAPQDLLDVLAEHDLEIVTEHGVTRGEVLGLEVARLVIWPSEAGGDDQLHLEVGVGRFDRDAVWAVNAGENLENALANTVQMVRRSRFPGAPIHAVQRLSRERWLRSTIMRSPELVGAAKLTAVGMTTEPAGMKDTHPAGAFGVDPSGDPVVVVASTGVDLAAVPLAADLRASLSPGARLVVALPPEDMHPTQAKLASMLEPAAEVISVPVEWG